MLNGQYYGDQICEDNVWKLVKCLKIGKDLSNTNHEL